MINLTVTSKKYRTNSCNYYAEQAEASAFSENGFFSYQPGHTQKNGSWRSIIFYSNKYMNIQEAGTA